MAQRREHDFSGEREILKDVYYGIQIAPRDRELSYYRYSAESGAAVWYRRAWICEKAAALANSELGVFDKNIAQHIVKASDRVISGEFNDQFITDLIQGGAGTSVNMNANEVIANVALEMMGKEKGDYEFCHLNNHVNCSQSTNDAYPTAFRIALINKLNGL